MHEAVEAASDVLVGQAVDALRGFVAQPLGLGHRADHGGGERLHRECRRDEHGIVQALCGRGRACRPFAYRAVVHPQEAVGRELQHERDGLRRVALLQLAERGFEARAGLRVAPEQPLDTCAGDGHPGTRSSASSGTRPAHSISVAWLSSKRPLAASAAAYVSSSSTRSSAGVVSGVSRTAAANQRAALAGAR